MSEPSDDQKIDTFANPESQVADGEASHTLARASEGGAVPSGLRDPEDPPGVPAEGEVEGTGFGDPLAGVEIDPQDAKDAVSGDTGPEHPGRRSGPG